MCRCFNGMTGSRPVAHQLTMTNTQGDPQAAQLLKLLHEFKSSSVRIVRPFMTLLRRWELVMGHANGFWRKNWACIMLQPNLCPGSWQLTRSSSTSISALNWTELKNKMAVIPHPPYSSDLAPCDFFLFPKMKLKLKGRWFDTIEEIKAELRRVLDTLIESVPKMEKTVGLVSTCRRELLWGWQWPIGLMVRMIFIASVRKILDTTLYMVITDTWHMQRNMTACLTKKLFLHPCIFLFWRVSFYLPPVVPNYQTDISYWNLSGTKQAYRRGRQCHREDNPFHLSAKHIWLTR